MKKFVTLVLIGILFIETTPKVDKTKYTVILKGKSTYLKMKAPHNVYTLVDSTKIVRSTDSAAYYYAYASYYYVALCNKGSVYRNTIKYQLQFTLLNWGRKDVSTLLSTATKNNIIRLVHIELPMDKIQLQ